LSIFDIAVLPSYTEGCSNALLEYMASEKPVVATDVGGNPELVTDEVTGFIVPRGDVPSLVQKVSYLIDSKDLRSKMGTAGGKKVKRFFSMSKIIDAQMNYYENLICWKERNESPHQHR
jgi:glycosyltransferase involved in cell wall biosynthesis